jgi:hypothetical protein
VKFNCPFKLELSTFRVKGKSKGEEANAQGIAVNEVTLAHVIAAARGIIDKPLQLDQERLPQALFIEIRFHFRRLVQKLNFRIKASFL